MKKEQYIIPQIKTVTIDNDIALILQSSPPLGPWEPH